MSAVHGILWFFGLYPVPPGTPVTYQLWSGFLPALAVVALLGSAVRVLRAHVCHEARCWRIGRHKVAGTPWCNSHHLTARRAAEPAPDPVAERIGRLADSVADLAEAVRAAMLPRETGSKM